MTKILLLLIFGVFPELDRTFKMEKPSKPGFYGVKFEKDGHLNYTEIEPNFGKVGASSTPSAWDFRLVKNSLAFSTVGDQGKCGSSWSFAATDVAASAIYLNKGINKLFSPEYLINCPATETYRGHTYTQKGCDGGMSIVAFIDIKKRGLVEWDCLPYVDGDHKNAVCPTTCADGSSIEFTKDDKFDYYDAYRVNLQILRDMVTTSGPVVAEFYAYDDLYLYTDGVYETDSLGESVKHAVVVYGFGTEDGMNYWLIKNSWGSEWGLGGFLKMRMGTDESDSGEDGNRGIEENFYSLYLNENNYPENLVPRPEQTTPFTVRQQWDEDLENMCDVPYGECKRSNDDCKWYATYQFCDMEWECEDFDESDCGNISKYYDLSCELDSKSGVCSAEGSSDSEQKSSVTEGKG